MSTADELLLVMKAQDQISKDLNSVLGRMDKIEEQADKTGRATQGMFSLGQAGAVAFGNVISGVTMKLISLTGDGLEKARDSLVSFDQGMIDISKTSGLTGQSLADLNNEILMLGTTTSTPIAGLQGIVAVAAQLGIESDKLVIFADVVNRFAIATELGATDAANALANVRNAFKSVSGDSIEDLERLGSALNELEDNTAARASEIIEALTRINQAAAIGLDPQFVAAFADVLIAAGFQASRAGTLINSAFSSIVTKAGDIAKVMGTTEAAFKQALEDTPREAVLSMLESFQKIESPIIRQAQIVEIFGETGAKAITGLVTNYGDLTRAIDIADRAFAENTSLSAAAALASESLSAQWSKLTNIFEVAFLKGTLPLTDSFKDLLKLAQDLTVEIFGLESGFDNTVDPIIDIEQAGERAAEIFGRMADVAEELIPRLANVIAESGLVETAFDGLFKGAESFVTFLESADFTAGFDEALDRVRIFATETESLIKDNVVPAIEVIGAAGRAAKSGFDFVDSVGASLGDFATLFDSSINKPFFDAAITSGKFRKEFGLTLEQFNLLKTKLSDNEEAFRAVLDLTRQGVEFATALRRVRQEQQAAAEASAGAERGLAEATQETNKAFQDGAVAAQEAALATQQQARMWTEAELQAKKMADVQSQLVLTIKNLKDERSSLNQINIQIADTENRIAIEKRNGVAADQELLATLSRKLQGLKEDKKATEEMIRFNETARDGLVQLGGSIEDTEASLKKLGNAKVESGPVAQSIDSLATTFDQKFQLMQERSKVFLQEHAINMDTLVRLTEQRRLAFANVIDNMASSFAAATEGLGSALDVLGGSIGSFGANLTGQLFLEDVVRRQLELQEKALNAQIAFSEAQIRLIEAQEARIKSGEPTLLQIDVPGIPDAFKALVKELFKAILAEVRKSGGDSCCPI